MAGAAHLLFLLSEALIHFEYLAAYCNATWAD